MSENVFDKLVAEGPAAVEPLGVSMILTFDDGNRSDLEIAAPRLRRYNIKGLFFPCVGRFGHPDYLGPADLRQLAAEGFEIGSHGLHHLPWVSLDFPALHREIAGSKIELEQVLGAPVQSAAIPFGAYNRRVLAALRAAGYTTVYSSDSGLSYPGTWFKRRWAYLVDEPFEVSELVATSRKLSHRTITSAKALLKSLR
jgi:peptidoglycan/xylan/chitin deacetylase (PgdA/CDA1 family)